MIETEFPRPEPNYQTIENSQKEIKLQVVGTADYCRYKCDVQCIQFKPTLMFAVRSFKFSIRNDSNIVMPYKFKICAEENFKLDAGSFQVYPKEGRVPSQSDEIITVKFAPKEVDDRNARRLLCIIPDFDPEQEPLVIDLKGKSERPICHFELPPSNYREKKAQDMTPIDANLLIIEFESLGTKVKNTKRFYVVNPTA